MRFFLDHNFGPNIARGLKEFGEDVVHLTQEFDEDADDTVWLPEVGKRRWILVTRDRRIRYKPAELAAYRKFKIGGFVLIGKNIKGWDIIRQLIRNWHRMKELADKKKKPFLYKIPPKGSKLEPIPLC